MFRQSCVREFMFVNDSATTEIETYCYTLSLHDALPIFPAYRRAVVGTQQVIERRDVDDPVAERLLGGQVVLDLAVVVELALAQVDGEHLARSEEIGRAHV